MRFENQQSFDNPQSWLRATGRDPSRPVISTNGVALFYVKNGGMMSPSRYELPPDTVLYRFGAAAASVDDLKSGAWWIERRELDKLLSFGSQHGISVGMAARSLCLIPPGWSDLGQLISVRARLPLLGMRGLADSVHNVDGANMPHPNTNPARRLHQIFIPGLYQSGLADLVFSVINVYSLDVNESMRGWLYL